MILNSASESALRRYELSASRTTRRSANTDHSSAGLSGCESGDLRRAFDHFRGRFTQVDQQCRK